MTVQAQSVLSDLLECDYGKMVEILEMKQCEEVELSKQRYQQKLEEKDGVTDRLRADKTLPSKSNASKGNHNQVKQTHSSKS